MNRNLLDANNLAVQVRDLRRQAKMSQSELADKAQLSRTYISLIERGQATNITLGALRQVFEALERTPAPRSQSTTCARITELVEELSGAQDCREVLIAITKLEEAVLWLQSIKAKE